MNFKGSIFIYLLLILIVVGAILGWYFKDSISINSVKNFITSSQVTTINTSEFKNWHEFNNSELGMTLKYPPDWVVSDSGVISQSALPYKINEEAVYNIIQTSKHLGVLIPGLFDQDLFYKIYDLKTDKAFIPEYFNAENHTQFIKMSSGKILSDEPFVIFTLKADKTSTLGLKKINAFILNSNSLIVLSLSQNDNNGLEIFKKIVASARITKPN